MKYHSSSLSREKREERRLKAAALFKKGVPHTEIARILRVSPGAVTQWRKAYSRGGAKALKSKGHPGFASELTPKKRERFREAVLKGPLSYGYETNLWTLSRLADVMKKVTGISFSGMWTWVIMRELGFTPQKPMLKAKERNEKAIAEWKAEKLPGLKKMGRQTWILSGI